MTGTTQPIPPLLAPYELPQRNRHRAPSHEEIKAAKPLESTRSITATCSDTKRDREREPTLLFTSPRCQAEDDKIFPEKDNEALQAPEKRWEYISEQAGAHRQDGSLMVVNRNLAPQALKAGVTPQVGVRVRRLNLWLNHTEDILPEWLDVIATVFPNLEHLTLTEDVYPDDENAVSARMRRLYVLYRLPNLYSIDDMRVTIKERGLARPGDPNGNRVKRKEWVKDSLLDSAEDEEGSDGEDETGDNDENDESKKVPPTKSQDQINTEDSTKYETDSSHSDDSNVKSMGGKSIPKELIGISILDNVFGSGEQNNDSKVDATKTDGQTQQIPPVDNKSPLRNKDGSPKRSLISTTPRNSPAKAKAAEASATTRRLFNNDEEKREESPILSLTAEGINAALLAQRTKTPRQLLRSDTLEIVSVVSSHHDWSLACGVLGACSRNSLRHALGGAGGSTRKAIKNSPERREKPKLSVRKPITVDEEQPLLSPCQPVRRHSALLPFSSTPRNEGAGSLSASPSRKKNADVVGEGNRRPTVTFFPTDENESSKVVHKNIQPVEMEHPSPNKVMPPSKSLSSPFPMQFRERPPRKYPSTTPSLSISINTAVADDASSSVSLDDNALLRNDQQHPVPETPRSFKVKSMQPMETISGGPLPLVRVASSPTNLTPKWTTTGAAAAAAKGELPPPCPPGARRRAIPTTPNPVSSPLERRQARRLKRLQRQMKATKQTARSTSVMDMAEDDSDDDDSDEEEESFFLSDDDDDDGDDDVVVDNQSTVNNVSISNISINNNDDDNVVDDFASPRFQPTSYSLKSS